MSDLIIGFFGVAILGGIVLFIWDRGDKGPAPKPEINIRVVKIMQYRIDQLQLRILDIKTLPDGDKAMKEKIAARLKQLLDKEIESYNNYLNR